MSCPRATNGDDSKRVCHWGIVRDICTTRQVNEKVMRTILLIILILLLIAALPTWPYSSGWGYYPSGGLGLILVIILLVVLLR
jgi:hypothetical protein